MNPRRRQFTLGACALAAAPLLAAKPGRQRVVVIGGGWGGLAAARQLALQAPELDVVLIEKSERFVTLPLSNRWLLGLNGGQGLYRQLAPVAQAIGYRLIQREVTAIDRANRLIVTTGETIPYDWLVLSPGIREDWASLCGGDEVVGRKAQQSFFSGFVADADFAGLKERLAKFAGSNFLINIPPAPYRCPPAPYERAVMIAWFFKSRGLRSKLTLVEANAPWPSYQRIFKTYFPEQITYLPQTRVRQLDPDKRIASLDIDDMAFDDAILMPPQQAGELCWQAGLIDPGENGQPTGWAAVDPLSFRSRADPRIFVVGDSVGRVSPLFGHYPKTGQMAARMGSIAAGQIAALSRGQTSRLALPESTCYAQLNVDPPELAEIVASYTQRGDGALVQSIRQSRNNQPAGEADAWLATALESLFGS
jgi:NADPH-dependent 2,4-dienoyl-CoA reductase/sulfur reductase-like enzyme